MRRKNLLTTALPPAPVNVGCRPAPCSTPAALGDYRKALKHVPDHDESKKWIDQITGIYKMLNKEAPKEGEEPAPLPFQK